MLESMPAPDLRLFDCFCAVGRSTRLPLQPALTAEDLLETMDRSGVDEALVSSAAIEIASPLKPTSASAHPHFNLCVGWSVGLVAQM